MQLNGAVQGLGWRREREILQKYSADTPPHPGPGSSHRPRTTAGRGGAAVSWQPGPARAGGVVRSGAPQPGSPIPLPRGDTRARLGARVCHSLRGVGSEGTLLGHAFPWLPALWASERPDTAQGHRAPGGAGRGRWLPSPPPGPRVRSRGRRVPWSSRPPQ